MSRIESLNQVQPEQLKRYRDRWWTLLTSTHPLNQVKASDAIHHAYKLAGYKSPSIHFLKGPLEFQSFLQDKPLSLRLNQLGAPIIQFPLGSRLIDQIQAQISRNVWIDLVESLETMPLAEFSLSIYSAVVGPIMSQVATAPEVNDLNQILPGPWLENLADHQWKKQEEFLKQELRRQPGGDWLVSFGESLWDLTQPLGKWVEETVVDPLRTDPLVQEFESGIRQLAGFFSLFGLGVEALEVSSTEFYPVLIDFASEVLGCSVNQAEWNAFRSLYVDCGPMLTFENMCFVFERPTKLSFDEERRLHAEGEPAIAFDDGYGQYCFQGVTLPPKYGAVHPNLWKSHWILQEPNAELRRILILGIGYSRICQDLQAVEIDSWREYTLLRIDQPIDVEPVVLLKMTCPSTNSVHATRVPPHFTSARAAIQWMNWDIDPDDFSIES